MRTSGRRRGHALDIWPGFVDALATLIMVIVFVLMIFTLFQFHLKDLISGRDQALDQLSRRIGDLADQLALERRGAADLRDQINLLSNELTASIGIRDRLQSELATAEGRIRTVEGTLSSTDARRRELEALLTAAETRGRDLDARLSSRDAEARDLAARLAARDAESRDLAASLAARNAEARELAASLSQREAAARDLETRLSARDQEARELAARLATRDGEARDLAARLATRDGEARDLSARLATRDGEARDLARRLTDAEGRIQLTEREAAALTQRLAAAEGRAREAETRVTRADEQNADLTRRLQEADARTRDAGSRVTLSETQAAALAQRLAAAEARLREADGRLEDAFKSIAADREKIDVQLRELDALRRNIQTLTILRDQLERDLAARTVELRSSGEALGAERRLSSDAQFRVDALTRQVASLQQQLGRLEAALDASEAKSRDQQVQIVDLGRRLNMALASKVEELARYRSEFFGRLREALGDRADVRIVGDRFIFETEVLFESGSAGLQPEGRRQIDRVGAALREIAAQIPPEINWILQVDGHTDRRPVVRSFPSNWELSHARAMSVVRALVANGIPPERLAGAGYAEFQPIDPRDDETAYRRNRRIELKLTDR